MEQQQPAPVLQEIPQFQQQQQAPQMQQQQIQIQPGPSLQATGPGGAPHHHQQQPQYPVASAGKFMSLSVSDNDFDSKGKLKEESEKRIEESVHKACNDRMISRDIIRNYQNLAEQKHKNGGGDGHFDVFAYTCRLFYKQSADSDDE